MTDSERSRSIPSFVRLGVLALIALLVAVAVSSAIAAEPGERNGQSGSEATFQPELGTIPDEFDATRGKAAPLDTSDAQKRDLTPDDTHSFLEVFPPDERERITPTTTHPYSAVAQIEMYVGGSRVGTCTGTLVGPNAVITAGHCLYMPDVGWADAVAVIPGKDGQLEPYGYQWASNAWVPEEWIDSQNPYWDWGILRMPNSSLGNTVGWLEMGVLRTSSLTPSNFGPVIAGYPGDKTYGTMWSASKPSFTQVTPTHLYYMIDTAAGQSGAAIWRGSDAVIVGIHMGTISSSNVGTRIDQELLDDIVTGCAQLGCQLSYFIEGQQTPPTPTPQATPTPIPSPTAPPPSQPTPTPVPSPTPLPDPPEPPAPDPPGQPGNVEAIGSVYYDNTWRRTDAPIVDGHIARTWMWGPAPFTPAFDEPYLESPGGMRVVQYFDKSRMEITDPSADASSIWFVTNGLLARELITGERQLGDDSFQQFEPAQINVAGDGDDPNGPTYASFNSVMGANTLPVGSTITHTIDRNGNVGSSSALASYGVTAEYYVPETGHSVAAPFWAFMNSAGPVYENGSLTTGNLFENPFYATGFPLTEAYWSTVLINGQPQTVLIQVFERRVLTYAPNNPSGWQVEAGNVGIHYFLWRYVEQPDW